MSIFDEQFNERSPIGVFDSGIGGVTTLNAMVEALPKENFVYLGDFKYAPYGNKTDEEIQSRVLNNCKTLIKEGAKVIVAACNTATAAGIELLRKVCEVRVIGAEPALKPACERADVTDVAVMLTPAAARQPRFKKLMKEYGHKNIRVITPTALAEDIEKNIDDLSVLNGDIEKLVLETSGCQALVLGCTHYVFIRDIIQRMAPELLIFDGNAGIARRLKSTLVRENLLNPDGRGEVKFITS